MKEGAARGDTGGGEKGEGGGAGRKFKTWKKSPETRCAQGLNHRPFHSIVLTERIKFSSQDVFITFCIRNTPILSFSFFFLYFLFSSALVEVMCTKPGLKGFARYIDDE